MPSSIAIGLPPFLDVAFTVWRAIDPAVQRVVVAQHPDFMFDEPSLAAIPADGRAFVAIDNRFLNFKRLELAELLAARGIELASVVARTAVVDGATLGGGVFVGEGAVIQPGATIGAHACIGARAVIGANTTIGRGAWIDPAAIVGANVQLGDQTSVTSGVVIADHTLIGEQCVLAIPGAVRGTILPMTYFHPLFHEPIRVVGRS